MFRPAITDYIGALENPVGVFRTLGQVRPVRDIYGEVELRAGNSAAVFTYFEGGTGSADGGRRRFLKCYIRPNPHLRAVYAYVERMRPALLPEVRLLRDEMFVHSLTGSGYVDVVEGEWTEGPTLAEVFRVINGHLSHFLVAHPELYQFVLSRSSQLRSAQHLPISDAKRILLENLQQAFNNLCEELSEQEWAHGDLKPENIVLGPDGKMRLIDCDAMWIPELAGQRAAELGTPGYRDPLRTAADFDKSIDDYAMEVISKKLLNL